jgi:hypothetical protein
MIRFMNDPNNPMSFSYLLLSPSYLAGIFLLYWMCTRGILVVYWLDDSPVSKKVTGVLSGGRTRIYPKVNNIENFGH